jgi:hypothetical protein
VENRTQVSASGCAMIARAFDIDCFAKHGRNSTHHSGNARRSVRAKTICAVGTSEDHLRPYDARMMARKMHDRARHQA